MNALLLWWRDQRPVAMSGKPEQLRGNALTGVFIIATARYSKQTLGTDSLARRQEQQQ